MTALLQAVGCDRLGCASTASGTATIHRRTVHRPQLAGRTAEGSATSTAGGGQRHGRTGSRGAPGDEARDRTFGPTRGVTIGTAPSHERSRLHRQGLLQGRSPSGSWWASLLAVVSFGAFRIALPDMSFGGLASLAVWTGCGWACSWAAPSPSGPTFAVSSTEPTAGAARWRRPGPTGPALVRPAEDLAHRGVLEHRWCASAITWRSTPPRSCRSASRAAAEGVGDHDLLDRGPGDPLDGGSREQPVGGGGEHAGGALGRDRVGGHHEGAAGVDHVVDEHAGAASRRRRPPPASTCVLHAPLTWRLCTMARSAPRTVGVALGDLGPAGVGRHHGDIALEVRRHPVDQHRHGGEVVDGPVEEALDLAGVQVDAHSDGAAPADGEQVGDELGGDGLTASALQGPGVRTRRRGTPP